MSTTLDIPSPTAATGWLSPTGSPGIECIGSMFLSFKGTFPMPDPDINGIGVVISFIVASYTSFALGVVFYLLGCVPSQHLSSFEEYFIKPKVTPRLINDFQKGVSVVNEQQMITALGVLGAALRNMRQSTVFDFHTKIYLAWMAINMHLSTLSILRVSFWDRPWLRAFKILSMCALLVMMCIAIYPTIENTWAGSTVRTKGFCSSADSCFGLEEKVEVHWHRARYRRGSLTPQGVIAYIILIASHMWQSIMLFPMAHTTISNVCQKPLYFLERKIVHTDRSGQKTNRKIAHRAIIGTYMFVLASIEITGSWAFSQFLLGVQLSWSSFQLFLPRFINLPSCVAKYLNEMNFGQILPMMLLLAPVYSIVAYYLKYIQQPGSTTPAIGFTTMTTTTTTTTINSTTQRTQSHSPIPAAPTSSPTPSFSDILEQLKTSKINAHESLRAYFYSTPQFRQIVVAQCFIAFTSVVGHFLSAAIALHIYDDSATRTQRWYETSYKMWPTVLASACAFVLE
ncbi:hypothetical protein DPSP01_014287 [Paraphaeosphaeria sporulosa]